MLTNKITLIILGDKGFLLSFGLPDNLWVWWGSEMNN